MKIPSIINVVQINVVQASMTWGERKRDFFDENNSSNFVSQN